MVGCFHRSVVLEAKAWVALVMMALAVVAGVVNTAFVAMVDCSSIQSFSVEAQEHTLLRAKVSARKPYFGIRTLFIICFFVISYTIVVQRNRLLFSSKL